jgi:hypothetical protein
VAVKSDFFLKVDVEHLGSFSKEDRATSKYPWISGQLPKTSSVQTVSLIRGYRSHWNLAAKWRINGAVWVAMAD